jgi:hypothetical protein
MLFFYQETRFDKILQKMINQDIWTKIINAIKSMYSVDRFASEHNGKVNSSFIISHQGIKHGDPSSFLIFMMFLNDKTEHINTDINDLSSFNDFFLNIKYICWWPSIVYYQSWIFKVFVKRWKKYCNTFCLK